MALSPLKIFILCFGLVLSSDLQRSINNYLVWCLFVVGVVNSARVSNDLYYNVVQDRGNIPAVQQVSYHVPGHVYNVPSPLAVPPRTPASTVLLPMLGQSSGTAGGVAQDEVPIATPRINAFDSCVWLLEQCTGIDIIQKKPNKKPRSVPMTGVTPVFLPYGYGPVTSTSVLYPAHVFPQSGVQATTYGGRFWCGLFTWKCLPDIRKIMDNIENAQNLPNIGALAGILG